jgi:uncharacterized membrane-anchored protein YhcB (DUF1043 family)
MAPFSERLTLAIIGPLITVVLGTLVIGGLIQLISNKAQRDRARNERKLEQRRSDAALRHELVSDVTRTASTLYLAMQAYWRTKTEIPKSSREERAKVLDDLHKVYRASRTDGEVLAVRLSAYFKSDEPETAWHKVVDLLTVRYFQVIDRDTQKLYERNAKGTQGQEHSGLNVDQLQDPTTLLDSYRSALKDAVQALLDEPLRSG